MNLLLSRTLYLAFFCHCKKMAIFAMVFISSGALAQSVINSNIEVITTTATRTPVNAQNLPLVLSTVDDDALALFAPVHIEEVLKTVAGAGVQRGNGQEYLPALRSPVFSGAGACGGLLTMEDGIALRAAGFCNINELFEAHSEMAQRIEVLKGSGSVLYGSNAVHGVINVVTPDTTYDQGLVAFDYGSYGYSRAKLRVGKSLSSESGIGINASVTRDRGYRDDEGVDQEKVNIRYRTAVDALQIQSGLTYTNLRQDTAGYISGFESYKDGELAQQNANPDAFRDARSMRLWSSFQWLKNPDSQLTVTPYVRDQSMTFFMHFLPGTPMEENAQKSAGIQTLWQYKLADNWRLRTGADGEFTEGELQQYQDNPTTGSAFLVATIPTGKHYDFAVDATQFSPFTELTWHQAQWQVIMGLRYEYMHYDYQNHMLAGRTRDDGSPCGFGGCRYSRPESRTDSFTNLLPKLGLTYSLTDQTQLYANLSRGYRAPQATELYRLQRQQQVAQLRSETADTAEIGVKAAFNDLRYTVALYHMQKDHFIYRDSDFFNVNNGASKHQGVEVELAYQLADDWDISLAATYAKHTYTHSPQPNETALTGNDMDTAPRQLANTRLGWEPLEQARIELEWQHVGKYFTDPENLHVYAGHDIINLRGQYAVSDSLNLALRVLNIADTRYAERADYTSFGGDRYFPGRPRHILLSASYQW